MTTTEWESIGVSPRTILLGKALVELKSKMKEEEPGGVRRDVKARCELIKVLRLKSDALSLMISNEIRLDTNLFIIDYE